MAPIYFVNALGYECPPEFATLKAARVAMKEFMVLRGCVWNHIKASAME